MDIREIPGDDSPIGRFATQATSQEISEHASLNRQGSDKDDLHTLERLGYTLSLGKHGTVDYDTLTCADGVTMYRIKLNGQPLDSSDEQAHGWMTYDQVLCFKEGVDRLSHLNRFAHAKEAK